MVRSEDGHPLPPFPVTKPAYEVFRFSTGSDATLGALFELQGDTRRFLCFTVEDEYREEKVHGETRIPAGTYELKLRTAGGFHARYKSKFSDIHEGMIWVTNVPGFEWILWHVGNTEEDTAGCLLLGNGAKQLSPRGGYLLNSVDAYRRVYPGVRDRIKKGECFVRYTDFA